MFKIKVNNNFDFETTIKNEVINLNGNDLSLDMVNLGNNKFHIIKNNKSYTAELVDKNLAEKTFKIKVNNNIYDIKAKDQYDELLKDLGLENLNAIKLKEIKAPMPGLVLKILINEGDEVRKGENLFILEAMKMENMIKAPADIIIKKLYIKSGDKVEKNQILVVLN
ncbi:acetyl-CoA carboxylase biotin carboxyl carrier protein subunit [Pedobacter psychrophilus]|uniref:Acetyl-CoA carboxylase biotin carboxyl carrier protein subunit n=1 Tax=Pedobacter psychrophilus TaxID=1826909 RepID=A0A179DBK6_9SPHI|nr:acetyl-CoA carboxylase biotin carboxyl carrier protein subunit [Pedobacter psychrophilus]OAQ38435.1 acetyl-CoA carboxylase biotin carboxyl carrier protein subunit [Pedobacter psychrophilus]